MYTRRNGKRNSSRRQQRPRGRRNQSRMVESKYYGGDPIPRSIGNVYRNYTTRFEYGLLSAGSSGLLSANDISPSIVNATEYSTVSSLFTEIRLRRFEIIITAAHNDGAASFGRLIVGTQMQANATSPGPAITSLAQVENLAKTQYYQLGNTVEPFKYQMVVPPNLQFASISADAPTPVTPYAGSPGCIYMFANDLTYDQVYLKVDCIATYDLRGRV